MLTLLISLLIAFSNGEVCEVGTRVSPDWLSEHQNSYPEAMVGILGDFELWVIDPDVDEAEEERVVFLFSLRDEDLEEGMDRRMVCARQVDIGTES